MSIQHFLKDTDFDYDTVSLVLEEAAHFKATRGRSDALPLAGQTWGMLFHKSSTRTRVSFEVGIHELGGHAMLLDQSKMQTGRGETVEDTARVLSRYLHGMVIRTYEQGFIEAFARAGSIPVVNALTDQYHPCQIYSDALTLAERWGKPGQLLGALRGRKLAFFGDCGSNMAHSWILGGALFGMEIVLAGPGRYAPDAAIDAALAEAGLEKSYTFTEDAIEAASGADVAYTDVWVSMGDEAEREERLAEMQPYRVTDAVMSAAADGAVFMHCLPAHEGEEVSESVYRSPASIVYDQAENRLHCQKAILSKLASSRG